MPMFNASMIFPRKSVNVKTIIYLTLFAVAFLHLVSSLPALHRSYRSYNQAKRVHYLNDVSDDLYAAVGNFGFERGRVNVVLSDAGPVEGMQSNRQFIMARRHDGNQALKRALSKLKSFNLSKVNDKISEINQLEEGVETTRGKVDQNIIIPKTEREEGLAEPWFAVMTRYIETIETLLLAISGDISDADGMISRYSILKHETLALRNTAGPEMSILSATMLSGAPIHPPSVKKIEDFQIRTRLHFENLTLLSNPLADPTIPQALEVLKQVYFDDYRPYRDTIFPLALKGGPYPCTQPEFLAHGVNALQQITEFMKTIVTVTRTYADEKLYENKMQIFIQLFSSAGSLAIIIIIFFLVHLRVIRPISRLTSVMRRLASKDLSIDVPMRDAQDEIGEMARSVEIFKGMALQLEEDVIHLKQVEERLLTSEERFRTVADFSHDWEYWIDPEGRFNYISPSCERITGYHVDDFIADDNLLSRICLDNDDDTIKRHLVNDCSINEPQASIDFRIRGRHGGVRWINHICQPIIGNDGNFLGRRACNRDITEQKILEEDLIRAKKLEATAILAGGIAHDFNNIMAAMLGNLELAEMECGGGDGAHAYLHAAKRSLYRARDLTSKFLALSSGGAPVKTPADIIALVVDSTALTLAGTNIQLHTNVPDQCRQANIDKGQISQVVNNVVINAKEAMPDGGNLYLSIENLEPVTAEKLLSSTSQGNGYVKIVFRDDGIGIHESNLAKVFDPYFSSKKRGTEKGMGLGLTIAHSIVERHGGRISIASEVQKGTSVCIYLPVDDRLPLKSKGAEVKKGLNRFHTGQRKVLIMDDEELIRTVISKILSRSGFLCDLAQNGDEAVDKFRKATMAQAPFDVVIMDLTVPGGKGGVQAVKDVLEIDPQAKVIVASGYSSDPVMDNFAAFGFCAAIVKPFKSQELLDIIKQL